MFVREVSFADSYSGSYVFVSEASIHSLMPVFCAADVWRLFSCSLIVLIFSQKSNVSYKHSIV